MTALVQASLSALSEHNASNGHVFPFALVDLLNPGNACVLAQCELFLESKRQYNALALLFQSKCKSARTRVAATARLSDCLVGGV